MDPLRRRSQVMMDEFFEFEMADDVVVFGDVVDGQIEQLFGLVGIEVDERWWVLLCFCVLDGVWWFVV